MLHQIRYIPIFVFYRQKQRITSCMLLCRTVSSWGCAASLLHSLETGTAPTTACVSCGLSLSMTRYVRQGARMTRPYGLWSRSRFHYSYTLFLLSSTDIASICYLSASAASQRLQTNWDDYPSVLICRTSVWLKLTLLRL